MRYCRAVAGIPGTSAVPVPLVSGAPMAVASATGSVTTGSVSSAVVSGFSMMGTTTGTATTAIGTLSGLRSTGLGSSTTGGGLSEFIQMGFMAGSVGTNGMWPVVINA